MLYFVADDSKDIATQLPPSMKGDYTEEAILGFMADNTWLGDVAAIKDEL